MVSYIYKEKNIFLLLISAGILFLAISLYDQSLVWDETVFLSNAKSLIGEKNYSEGYRPPLLPLTIGIFWLLTGKSVLVAKIIAIAFSLFAIFVFYKICKLYFKKPIYPSILFTFSPLMLFWSFRVYTDIPSLFFILLAYYFVEKKIYFKSGIAAALSILSRFPSVIFAATVLIYLLMKKKYKELGFFILGSLLFLAPWMVYNYITYGNPLQDFIDTIKFTYSWTSAYKEPLTVHITNVLYAFNFLVLFLIFGLYKFFMERKKNLLIIYIILSLVFYVDINIKDVRYYIMVLPFICLAIYEGITAVTKNSKIIFSIIIASLAISSAIVSYQIQKDVECWPATKESIDYIASRVNEKDTVVSNFWPYFGFFTNATVFSNYDELDVIIKWHNPKFLVFREQGRMDVYELPYEPEWVKTSPCGYTAVYRTESIN